MANWGSIIGDLASLGASPSTMNVALEGYQHSMSSPAQFPAFTNPAQQAGAQQLAAQQMQALNALLSQQQRPVDVSQLDLSGLWLALNSYMEVVRDGDHFSYEARTALEIVIERGTLRPAGAVVELTAQNIIAGSFTGPLTVVNEDLLLLIRNGAIGAALRRISTGTAKPYLSPR